MKKFEKVATFEGSPKWEQSIKRESKLYTPLYGRNTMRTDFDRDYTRVINSMGYRRMKHKTQVFFSPQNDHVCTRIEHVNLVDSISHTISNYLGLNNELTKAIAISHDIGHSPFGHQGEKVLSDISKRDFGETFWHERNGLNFVDNIELLEDYNGQKQNLNLTYAVRDGIISHCGEVDENALFPRIEAIDLQKEYLRTNQHAPYTWEGCVVKVADKISYIGRDIEDAITMKILTRDDVEEFNKIINNIRIGNTNIINYLVTDVCKNSSPETGLNFSKEAFETMNQIKRFNYEKIYLAEQMKPAMRFFKVVLNEIYYILREAYDRENTIQKLKEMSRYYPHLSGEFVNWLSHYTECSDRDTTRFKNKILFDLKDIHSYEKAIIYYISGMTDNYMEQVYKEIISL